MQDRKQRGWPQITPIFADEDAIGGYSRAPPEGTADGLCRRPTLPGRRWQKILWKMIQTGQRYDPKPLAEHDPPQLVGGEAAARGRDATESIPDPFAFRVKWLMTPAMLVVKPMWPVWVSGFHLFNSV